MARLVLKFKPKLERKEKMFECKLRNGYFRAKEERKNLIEIQKQKQILEGKAIVDDGQKKSGR